MPGDHRKIERAELPENQERGQGKAEVANAVDDERLVAGVGGDLLIEVEADQQVAAQAHSFPADEEQQIVARQHQRQHEEHEQVQVAHEPVKTLVLPHISDGIDMNQEANASYHEQHHQRKLIEIKIEINAKRARA